MKVLHIITALDKGGAETNLFRLTTSNSNLAKNYIISLKKNCYFEDKLIKNNIKVYAFNFTSIFLLPLNLFKIVKLIYTIRPDIINTWMYHANFISIILKPFLKKKIKIIWNIRHSTFDIKYTKFKTLLIIYLSILFSYIVPAKIIYNSFSGKKNHEKFKYCKKNSKVILNGFDHKIFNINNKLRDDFVSENNLNKNTIIFGAIGRYRKQKNYINLIKMLSKYNKINNNFICVLVGYGLDNNNEYIVELIKKNKLGNQIKLYGQTDNIHKIMNIIDLNILYSNYGEGFPNVIAESMLCGTPTIAHDVGDAKNIVNVDGWIVENNNMEMFLKKISEATYIFYNNKQHWVKLKNRCRERILSNFKIDIMIQNNTNLWKSISKIKS